MENYLVSPFPESQGEGEEVAQTSKVPSTWSRAGSFSSIPSNGDQKQIKKQRSLRETKREAKWEKRRRQVIERQQVMLPEPASEVEAEDGNEGRSMKAANYLTDEDLDELRACIELGFGFREEEGGHHLRHTVPALDLYFAVNRQLSELKLQSSTSPVSTPSDPSSPTAICHTPNPWSPTGGSSFSESWRICSPGENPQYVKPRLMHWVQAVACYVKQVC